MERAVFTFMHIKKGGIVQLGLCYLFVHIGIWKNSFLAKTV